MELGAVFHTTSRTNLKEFRGSFKILGLPYDFVPTLSSRRDIITV